MQFSITFEFFDRKKPDWKRDFFFLVEFLCRPTFLNFEDQFRKWVPCSRNFKLLRNFFFIHWLSGFLAGIAFFRVLRLSKACAHERATVWTSLVSRVKPCVTHDIYKGFSIRKTHIIETTCNILSYRRDTIMVHTYAYVCARTRVARVSCTCVRVCLCVRVCIPAGTYIYI